jgi:hypothetical protein
VRKGDKVYFQYEERLESEDCGVCRWGVGEIEEILAGGMVRVRWENTNLTQVVLPAACRPLSFSRSKLLKKIRAGYHAYLDAGLAGSLSPEDAEVVREGFKKAHKELTDYIEWLG